MKNIATIILLLSIFLPAPARAQVATTPASTSTEKIALSGVFEATPSIIDEKAKARDILKYRIKLTNGKDKYVSVYPMVNDISMTEGKQKFEEPLALDKKTSLARWITMSRGVKDIAPGESITIPIEIKVDLEAVPGKRYAVLSFPEGSNRPEAQKRTESAGTPKVNINIEVEEEIVERAQIKDFFVSKNVYVSFPVDFNLVLENFGNRQVSPQGSIIIYNRRGEEVSSLDLGSEHIEPDTSRDIKALWSDGSGFGKFKARLELEYGKQDKRDLQDTIYFWILPLPLLITFFVVTLLLIVVITMLLFKKTYHHYPHIPHPHLHSAPHKQVDNNSVINLREK